MGRNHNTTSRGRGMQGLNAAERTSRNFGRIFDRGILSGWGLAGVLVALGTGGVPSAVKAGGAFDGLAGTWRGAAQVKLTSGSQEALKCHAYYTPKGTGSNLGIAILCASASNRIELRAQLTSVLRTGNGPVGGADLQRVGASYRQGW